MSNVCYVLLVVPHFQGHCFVYVHHCSLSLFYVDSRQWSACLSSNFLLVRVHVCTAVNVRVLPYLKEMLQQSLNNV